MDQPIVRADDDPSETIIAMERAALDRWGKGDPSAATSPRARNSGIVSTRLPFQKMAKTLPDTLKPRAPNISISVTRVSRRRAAWSVWKGSLAAMRGDFFA